MLHLHETDAAVDKVQKVGIFFIKNELSWSDTDESLVVKAMILSNLARAARLCGVLLVGPHINSENPLEDYILTEKMIPILRQNLSKELRLALRETLPKLTEIMAKNQAAYLADVAEMKENAKIAQSKNIFLLLRRMLRPSRKSPVIKEDGAVLPTVRIEVVHGEKKLGKDSFIIRAFPLEEMAEKMDEAGFAE